jgi:hypothetical protein
MKTCEGERGLEGAVVTLAEAGARQDRGRDGHCWPPPAQIRTGPIQASGSYLGWLAKNRSWGQG